MTEESAPAPAARSSPRRLTGMNPLAWLRRQPAYLDFRWATREGLARAWRRHACERRILDTPPLWTAAASRRIEVRALTWRRDCLDLIWALKSFYFFAGVDYPLVIHDGGLLPRQLQLLRRHFPNAGFVTAGEAELRVPAELERRGLRRCRAYRRSNVATRKLFDFFLFSAAEYVISIDSDIVFFRRPDRLCIPPQGDFKNRYNKDAGYWYSMSLDELEANFGIRPPERINSGLSLVRRASMDFEAMERWLAHPKLFADQWVTEQTLHALCAGLYGFEFLPDTYCVSTSPGLSPEMVCKHYPGFFRYLQYEEGMARLIETGFLQALRRQTSFAPPASPETLGPA